MTKLLLSTALLMVSLGLWAQSGTDSKQQALEPSSFNDTLLERLIFEKINLHRKGLQTAPLDTNYILYAASENQVKFMAKYGEAEIRQSGKTKTTAQRIAFAGGSAFGEELVYKHSVKTGDKAQTYEQVAEEIASKWLKSKKTAVTLENPKMIFAGLCADFDANRSKLYLSVVVGNYKSFKSGFDRVAELTVPISKKKYGLKPYDEKICKKVDQYKNLSSLQDGLVLEDGIIYFETDKYASFKKIMKASKDGIAVDIVQKEQFACGGDNIVDNSKPWKGILLKPIWSAKMLKKNLYTDKKERKTKLKVKLAAIPKGLGDNIDLNLIVIQNKSVCADIMPNYEEDAGIENGSKLDILFDTTSTDGVPQFLPVAENSTLSFRVPFERNKFTYNNEDIQPIIKSLKEPDFIINRITIDAFSSIEGDVESNKRLQKNRGESIESALKSFISTHKNLKKATVNTDENWELFKADIANTEYANMANMTIEEAQSYIKAEGLTKTLEPILEKHRYAQVTLEITYDVTGKKEEAYVLNRFNKSVEAGDKVKALAIQKYIIKKVIAGTYTNESVTGQVIPENAAFSGILMNKYWLLKYIKQVEMDDEMCQKINTLFNLDPSNQYLHFNDVYCDIKSANLADEKKVNDLRQRINKLYETKLPEQTVDGLNLEYLFGVIEAVDTVPETPELAVRSLEKIKELVDIDEMNWKNALKLSYLFIAHNDFNYSAKLLEPFLRDGEVFDEILFTYISLATHSETRVNSNCFYTAVLKAKQKDPARLKQLFDSGRISNQVLQNLKVKALICNKK